jgi:pimeloyl-ACP methyl ester carboxylesterase
MSLSLDASIAGKPSNALFLAKACDLAYYPEAEGVPRFRSELGLEARLISVDNTQVYVAEDDRSIVVAFRGSEAPTTLDGLKDWLLTNANNYLILPEGRAGTDFAAAGVGARFHRGFLDALGMVWEPLLAAVDAAQKAKERPLWVTGHSLGGALALLAAWRLQRSFMAVQEIVTFGAPMVGNEAASQAFAREFPGKIFRYIDLEDVVPHLPTVSLIANAYTHCLSEVALSAAAAAAAQAALAALQPAAGAGEGEGEPRLDPAQADRVWEMVKGRIASHMIANYQARVQARCQEPA